MVMFTTRRPLRKIAFEIATLTFSLLLLGGGMACQGGGPVEGSGTGGSSDITDGTGGTTTAGGTGGGSVGTQGGGGVRGTGGAQAGVGGVPGTCAGALVKCNGVCVDTTGSQTNCGTCGTTCRADQTCWLSACKCATGSADCSGVCKDVTSSTLNCGACGNVCATGATCISGVCTCPTQQVACSGACKAVNTDPQNCGKCGTVCGAGTSCLFGACLDPNSLACAPSVQANTSSTRDAFITLGKYWANNNEWGANTGTGTQTIWSTCTQGDLIGWGTSWNWTGTANQVKTYASTVLGWQWGWRLTTSGLPLQISSGKKLTCGWDFTMTQSGGAANVAYDIFVHTQAMAGTNDNPSDEIMVWLYRTGGAGPIGTLQGTATVGGTTWDVYRGTTVWNVVSYVRQTNATTAVLNIMDFMNDLVTRGWMQTSKYVSSVQSGSEIFTGTGRLDTKGYYCRIQ